MQSHIFFFIDFQNNLFDRNIQKLREISKYAIPLVGFDISFTPKQLH
jgi:hypothetical protein